MDPSSSSVNGSASSALEPKQATMKDVTTTAAVAVTSDAVAATSACPKEDEDEDDIVKEEEEAAVAAATTTTTTTSPPSAAKVTTLLCRQCQKRHAHRECPAHACHVCCTTTATTTTCPKHAAMRAKQQWRQRVLEGKTDVQLFAAAKRKALLPKHGGKFHRESGFVYAGDTVVIWNLREYYDNPKWRDDARRRSIRRQQTEHDTAVRMLPANGIDINDNDDDDGDGKQYPRPPIKNSRKRFRQLVEGKYQDYLQNNNNQKK
eukprot:scaffold4525_cov132-Amphora_coffeaeformis.AAC.3